MNVSDVTITVKEIVKGSNRTEVWIFIHSKSIFYPKKEHTKF